MFDSLSVSNLLGYASIGCWLGAQFPQVVENIKLQSCEGLALPFLANWLMGDISNLVGCILTHQLPFQTYLATYFVCVDFMLVAQYYYYYKPPKGPPSVLSHIRSATTPGAIRRMSIDRGASRYRTLSAVASNVAVAAALAAQQDEADERRSSTRYSKRIDRQHTVDGSASGASHIRDGDEEEYEDNIPSSMIESFRSERVGDHPSKRVSWSIERSRGRAASVGRPITSPIPTSLQLLSEESTPFPRSAGATHPDTDLNEPIVSSRGTRASRKGSTMVFLGAWALFGFGTLASQRGISPSAGTTNVGHVLSSIKVTNLVPIALDNSRSLSSRDISHKDSFAFNLELASSKSSIEYTTTEEDPHEDPTSEQVLGRIFAWLCTTLYLTSRLPQIWKNYVRKSVEGLSMYLFVFAFLGNCFYVSSILVSPRRFLPPPESTQFIRESIPYLLGSGGTLVFDITIVAQSFCYKPRHKRHSVAHTRPLDDEEAALLSGDALSAHPDSAITNRGRTSRIRST